MRYPKFLWIDGIGGYEFCSRTRVTIGLATVRNSVDLAIRGRIATLAGVINRVGGEDFIAIGTREADESHQGELLLDGSFFKLGDVSFQYTRPSPLSDTSLLSLIGPGSWAEPIDGALLAGSSVIIGPFATAHVRCPDSESGLVLFKTLDQRNGEERWVARTLDQSGRPDSRSALFQLPMGQRIECGEFSICLE